MIHRLLSVIYIVYCFEVGLFLILFPWFGIWENNVLIHRFPILKVMVTSGYMKGAITGLGVSNLVLGVLEIANFRQRRPAHPID